MARERDASRRAQLLDGAALLLDGGSLDDLTVGALAQTLRMSKSTLYRFYTSKEDLVIALVDSRCGAAVDALERASSFAEWSIASGRFLERTPSACLRETAELAAPSQRQLSAVRAAMERSLTQLLESARTEGHYTGPRSALCASAVVAAAWQAALEARPDEGRAEMVSELLMLFRPSLGL